MASYDLELKPFCLLPILIKKTSKSSSIASSQSTDKCKARTTDQTTLNWLFLVRSLPSEDYAQLGVG